MKIRPKDIAADRSGVVPEGTVVFGFDRVTVWIDRPELPIALDLLNKHCVKAISTLGQLNYHARWKLKVELFQPGTKCLQLLAKALGQDVGAYLTYVEIACDIEATGKSQALQWRNQFLAVARVKYQRQAVKRHRTSWYYGRRYSGYKKPGIGPGDKTAHGDKRGNVLVVYADKPSKLNNARPMETDTPCCHIEWRTSGSSALARLGIVSLEDLIRFDHLRFWNAHVWTYKPLRPTCWGRLLAKIGGTDATVSGSALRKRAKKWQAEHSISGKFVLHNALLKAAKLTRLLKTMTFEQWVKDLSER